MEISEQELSKITKAKTKKLNAMRGVAIQDDENIFNNKQNNNNNNTFQFDARSLAKWHGEGKVEIPVEEFLRLLGTNETSHSLSVVSPPQNFFISKASYVGHAKENYINLQCSFEVAILVDTWTRVKLMPDGVGLSSHSLSVSLFGNIENISNSNNNNNNANPHRARLGVMEDGFWLVTEKRGEYLVSLTVRVPYHSPRKSGLSIWVPRASENSVTFTVKMKDIQIKVDPSFVGDDSEENKNGEKKDESSVSVLFPPTNSLNINWTVKIDEGPSNITKDAPNKKMMITAEHNSMCSIGEGVVLLSTVFSYSIVHGSVSTFEILVPDDLHVLGVEGNGLKKWEVIGGKDKTALIELDDTKSSQRCLRVVLDYGLENSYTMTVLSEVSMAGTSADVTIPSFKCIGEEINREKGYLAIEARTNVEIAEIHREFLALVDTTELPQTLWKLAGNPILMGYKFLSGYELGLRVKKHDDVGVLVAACDDAHFITTVSQEGRILHKLILRIRNTQKQYVRVKIPVPHEIWSASVAGVPIKPAMDETGQVMVQLKKMSGKSSHDNPNNVFVVELVYIENQERPMGKTGNISISLAQLDIPINYLFVSFYLPSEFQYTEFVGGLKEVNNFSRNPPTEVPATTDTPQYQTMPQQSNFRARSNSITMDSMPKRSAKAGNFGQNKGVLPVKVQMPVSGTEFKFEQLIVMAASLTVTTTYTKTVSYSHNWKSRHFLCFYC